MSPDKDNPIDVTPRVHGYWTGIQGAALAGHGSLCFFLSLDGSPREINMTQAAETTQPGFAVGDWAVHPAHGVGKVDAIEERALGSTMTSLYVLSIISSELRVMVPVPSAGQMGLRAVMSADTAQEVLASLEKQELSVPSQTWNRRLRAYNELLSSGQPLEVAKVLRDMRRTKQHKDLSFGERRLLEQAVGLLLPEIALATDRAPADVESQFDEIFAPSGTSSRS